MPDKAAPPDPTGDYEWPYPPPGTLAGVQSLFNAARANVATQLGISLASMTLPSQSEWDVMTASEKALWLVNRERLDRGVPALQGVETNVIGVAQTYAQYLLDNDTWGHYADGRSPWQRLADNPTIGACSDFLSVAENLYMAASTSSIAFPVERAVFNWMYNDGSCCGWGHRYAILYYPYNDNSGTSGVEGFFGIGRASGGPYQGPFSKQYPFAEIIVMNVFDPCATWTDASELFADGFEYGDTSQWSATSP